MKNFIVYILLASALFTGCDEPTITTESTKTGGTIISDIGLFREVIELYEFEYKGHTYISTQVHSGISLTHAGHCSCNDTTYQAK